MARDINYRLGKKDIGVTKKTGASKEERMEWSDKVNDLLTRMREADKAGEAELANSYGTEANEIFVMGPVNYSKTLHNGNR